MRPTTTLLFTLMIGCSSERDDPAPPTPAPAPSTTDADAGGDITTSCTAAGGDCRDDANACCNGTTCVFDTADRSKAVCAATCLSDDQCNSGCCTALIEGTQAVCAPPNYCASACATPGTSCETTACCANAVCVVSTVTGTSCAARCATHEQCVSGCCAPLDNTAELVCSPPTFCR